MKTKLLPSLLIAVLISSASYAQTKVWDFGNDTTTWPLSTGITTETVIDNLGLYPISTNTNFGAVTANTASFSDGYTAVQRFQMNGGGGVTAPTYMPTQRYLYFDVDSDCQVSVWFKTGSNGAVRTVMVTDGTSLIGSGTSNSGENADLVIFTANYTSATGGRLYIYGDTANNLYKVQVTGANVSTAIAGVDNLTKSQAMVYSNGKQAFISNVKSDTQVSIYNVAGVLVKKFNTSQDMALDFLTSGFYIVNVKSEEGNATTKIVVQ
ncbi:T9SS type A sorting domain-containing protein [Flavobacterium sp. RHBU_3]|uniref:T9SS type A sorting domain-containing protein n=1 Tax=Flavobacterium sp. RHBU_3 TaxID=3391184 RepID=UPI0039851A9D